MSIKYPAYKSPVAEEIPFDNADTPFTADNVEGALKEIQDVVEGRFDFSNATSFEVFSDDTTSNTTSSYPNFINKLNITSSTNQIGRYVVNWYFETTSSNNNIINWVRVQWKPTTSMVWTTLTEIDVTVPRGESYFPIAGFKTIDVISVDNIDLRIQFCRNSSATARIRNTNIYLFRVAL